MSDLKDLITTKNYHERIKKALKLPNQSCKTKLFLWKSFFNTRGELKQTVKKIDNEN